MSASLKANEPSMEEILASIRRIIAEDTTPSAEAAPDPAPASEPEPAPEPAAAVEDEEVDVLDLASIAPPADPDGDIEFREISEPLILSKPKDPEPEPEPPPRAAAPRPPLEPVADADGLLSPAVAAAVSSAFVSLGSLHVPQGGHTLEDLVKEMLRPMLKAWLDENLPGLVETLVRAEIERLSRSPRG